MRKFILAFVALLSLPSACYAAFAIFQTYAGPPQIFYNIVTDGGAACVDNHLTVTRTLTIPMSSTQLTISVATFTAGDVGKAIVVGGAGAGGPLYTTIVSVDDLTSPQHITLGDISNTALTASSQTVAYGADIAAPLKTFNTWALANQGANKQVVLTFPAGCQGWFGTRQTYTISQQNAWASGINNLIVEGTGSTLTSIDGAGFWMGNAGSCTAAITSGSGCAANIQSVSAGASVITLTSASVSAGYISRFSVGQWIQLGGLNTQALFLSAFGNPPNNTYFEWRQIVSCNAAPTICTGSTITLDHPLSNSYLSTWPSFNDGGPYPGGPATIWTMGGAGIWNATLEFRGLTINQVDQTQGPARTVIFRNSTFSTGRGYSASETETFTAINTTWPGLDVEVDKLIGTINLDTVTAGIWAFQSNSVNVFNVSNSNFTNTLNGSAKQTTITDSTINNWNPGTITYGAAPQSLTLTRTAVTTMFPSGPNSGALSINQTQTAPLSMSSGIIKWSRSQNELQRWASPIGANLSIANAGSQAGPDNVFQVQSVTGDPWPAVDNQTLTTTISIPASLNPTLNVPSAPFVSGDAGKTIIINGAGAAGTQFRTYIISFTDAANVVVAGTPSTAVVSASQTIQWGTSNIYVQTSMPGGFPTPSGCCLIQAHPAPVFTCDACTGDPILTAMNVQRGATAGAPMGQSASRDYAPTFGPVTNLGGMYIRGLVTGITIDVTTAYTGAGSATLSPFGQSHYFAVKQSDWSNFDWLPIINLKQPGTRAYTFAGGWTCNTGGGPVAGGCLGDTVTGAGLPSEQVWLRNDFAPSLNNSITCGGGTGFNCPVFTITAQTTQGVVP